MKTINLTINDQKISASEIVTVNGTVGVIECEFSFNDYWNEFPTRRAIFENDKMKAPYEADIINNKCMVPWEVLKREGCIYVAIVGTNTSGQIDRTNTVHAITQMKTLQGGDNSIEPTPDQYAQYVQHVGEKIEEYFDVHYDDFEGPEGFSPIATVTPTSDGAKISITDKEGTTEATVLNGAKGDSYVITEADYQAIGDKVEAEYTPELTSVKESIHHLRCRWWFSKHSKCSKHRLY